MLHHATAVNSATQHENRIHSDEVAAQYGFRGGLVPGVNVYGCLTVPVVRHYGREWLERGWIRVRFRKPFYEGEEIVVEGHETTDGVSLDAGRASAEAGLHNEAPLLPIYESPLPGTRPLPSTELIKPGAELGSFSMKLPEPPALGDPLEHYKELAHPTVLLGLANDILVRNFVLPAWIHTASEVRNYRAARLGETVSVRGRIRDAFNDKGREFLVGEISVVAAGDEVLLHIVHAAIWHLK